MTLRELEKKYLKPLIEDQIRDLKKAGLQERVYYRARLIKILSLGKTDLTPAIYDFKTLNKTEHHFAKEALKRKWCILRNGVPDFLLVDPEGTIHWVEVKSDSDELSKEQMLYHKVLSQAGLDVTISKNGQWCF